MATSQAPTLIDAIVTALQAAPELVDVRVIDGPIVADEAPQDWIFVGYDGNPEGDFGSVSTDQEWAGIGAKRRDESIAVVCSVVATRQLTDIKSARDRAYALFAVVEDTLREDPSMGMPPPTVAEVTVPTLHQEPTDQGMQARLTFTVACQTRI